MDELWNWLSSNSSVVSSASNVAMVLVWILYLQIALTTFIRQRRPRIEIDQSQGHGVRSIFMVINLSQEPIHISCVLVAFNVGEREAVFEITDYEHSNVEWDSESDSSRRWEASLKHGPLNAGEFLVLGGLPVNLVEARLVGSSSGPENQNKSLEDRFNECAGVIDNFEIRVMGVFSTDERTVGASRKYTFDLKDERSPRILPESDRTEQLASRRGRRTLREWSDQCRAG